MTPLPPGSTIGIVGGGQLGRMLAMAAAQLGYRCHIYAPDEAPPAAEVAAHFTRGEWRDAEALCRFAGQVDVATYEFENVDRDALAAGVAGKAPLFPSVFSLDISAYRPNEKGMVETLGGACARWRPVESGEGLARALAEIGTPAILKTCAFGYDGKGQARIDTPGQAQAAWDAIGRVPAIVERRVDFLAEFSVPLCRGRDGDVVFWDSPENVHRDGILCRSTVPAGPHVVPQVQEARRLSARVAERLDHVGVLTLEYFATREGPLFNEMAPRVHNSAHWTIEGAVTSQFENHVRAVCGLPLGDTSLTGARVEMTNLIGEKANRWAEILREPGAHLHLYGKDEPRPGRKMGHVTRVSPLPAREG
ncbi:MAG: 5-(carboxyamino)imidazole ribonucleotide synthase [Sphingomonadales bacterium]|jgi:5-(carboxyamino)imidazole ribonucleotide synthase|nr:5-(carboxyamino)imidazole ribonucleotide synthase [Sphingomonadales bacterium]